MSARTTRNNLSKGWYRRHLGEDAYREIRRQEAQEKRERETVPVIRPPAPVEADDEAA